MVEIQNLTDERLDQKYLLKVADIALKGEKISEKDLSIVFIDSIEMGKINYEHLGKTGPTDVLSFELGGDNWVMGVGQKELGEIFICVEEIEKNKKQEDDLSKEINRVLIHGILHLCGYDHKEDRDEEMMKQKENFYLSKI